MHKLILKLKQAIFSATPSSVARKQYQVSLPMMSRDRTKNVCWKKEPTLKQCFGPVKNLLM